MKHLMFAAAITATLGAFAVESDTVGYTQVEIKPGLNLIGTSFLKEDPGSLRGLLFPPPPHSAT